MDNRHFTISTKFLPILFILLGWLVLSDHTQAQTTYRLLAPLPLAETDCTGSAGEECQTTTSPYIRGVFILVIGLAGVLAVVKIIFGGIQYMSTDAFSGKSDAKETINNAIWGLLLVIGAWLILSTINPKLVSFNLEIERQTSPSQASIQQGQGSVGPRSSGKALPGYTLTPEQIAQDKAIRDSLEQKNVTVLNPPCVSGGTTGCTNVVLLNPKAIDGAIKLAADCKCRVIITSGSEGGHIEHGPNLSTVDLNKSNPTLNGYIVKNGQLTNQSCGPASTPKYNLGGTIYNNEGNHWHVCY